jgi:hypothetical protein
MGAVLIASAGKATATVNSSNGCQGSGVFRSTGLAVDAEAIGDDVPADEAASAEHENVIGHGSSSLNRSPAAFAGIVPRRAFSD